MFFMQRHHLSHVDRIGTAEKMRPFNWYLTLVISVYQSRYKLLVALSKLPVAKRLAMPLIPVMARKRLGVWISRTWAGDGNSFSLTWRRVGVISRETENIEEESHKAKLDVAMLKLKLSRHNCCSF
jgi:hypothetical protein